MVRRKNMADIPEKDGVPTGKETSPFIKKGLYQETAFKNTESQAAKNESSNEEIREVQAQIEEIVSKNHIEGQSSEQFDDFVHPTKEIVPFQAQKEESPSQSSQNRDISSEEVNEIQTQIEGIIQKNRLTLQTASEPYRKNEHTIPFIINSIVILLSVAIIWSITFISKRQDLDYEASRVALFPTEGFLLRQLQEEMRNIRGQLLTLEQEHSNALKRFEDRYNQKQLQTQELLRQDIENERQRLIAEGYSMEDIERLLAIYERERLEYYQNDVETYRQQIDYERELEEENFQRLQEQYINEIREKNTQTQEIQNESRQRINDMRLARENGDSQRLNTEQALSELSAMNTQRRQIGFEENRITSMFNQVRNSIQREEYQNAITQSESLIRYIEGTIQNTPEIQERRIMDAYLASSLARLSEMELNHPQDQGREVENINLSSQSSAEIGNRLSQNQSDIALLNNRILQLQAENTNLGQANSQISSQNQALNNQISQLQTENNRLNQESRNLIPRSTNQGETETLNNRISQLQSENARLSRVNDELSRSTSNRTQESQTEVTALNSQISHLQSENARLSRMNDELSRSTTNRSQESQTEVTALNNRISQLQSENARLSRVNEELSRSTTNRSQESQAEVTALNNQVSQLQAENVRLSRVNDELSRSAASRGQESQAEMTVLNNRISQLQSENSRLNRANQEFQNSGWEREESFREMILAARREGVANTMGILDLSLRIHNRETRRRFLENLKPRYIDEPYMIAFIDLLLVRL